MRSLARSTALLLPLLLTGCFFHKSRPINITQYLPPPSTVPMPEVQTVEPELSQIMIPNVPLAPDTGAEQAPKQPVRRRRPVNKNAPPAADATQQVANNTQPAPVEMPAVSAIGQLSTGNSSDLRQQTLDSIAATERGLNGINRALNDQEQKTASRIREFLKQAREALATGDLDGASTLAAKAKVLLGELGK
jgi:hypothetical protein